MIESITSLWWIFLIAWISCAVFEKSLLQKELEKKWKQKIPLLVLLPGMISSLKISGLATALGIAPEDLIGFEKKLESERELIDGVYSKKRTLLNWIILVLMILALGSIGYKLFS